MLPCIWRITVLLIISTFSTVSCETYLAENFGIGIMLSSGPNSGIKTKRVWQHSSKCPSTRKQFNTFALSNLLRRAIVPAA